MPEKGPQAGGTGGSETPKRHLDTRSPLGARPVPEHRKWPGDKRLTLKKYGGGGARDSLKGTENKLHLLLQQEELRHIHSANDTANSDRPSSVSGDSAIKAGKTDKGPVSRNTQ